MIPVIPEGIWFLSWNNKLPDSFVDRNAWNMLALRAKADRGCFFNRTPIFPEFLFFRYL